MIRCKKCAQSKKFELKNANEEVITFSFNDDNTAVVSAEIDEVDRGQEMYTAVEVAVQAVDGLAIICYECREENHITDARTAFEDPLSFFESENLCHCGKELWFDKVPGTSMYALICDDEECGWVKKKGAVSGA